MQESLNSQFRKIIESISIDASDILPSKYAEKNRTLSSDVSTIQGKFNYRITPYLREIIDTLSPYNPAKVVAVMKSAQIGFTEGVIVNGILWIIANHPGNIMALSANDDLSKEMVESRLDQGIASCGISHLIRPNTIRARNNRTGDTSKSKEFAGGRLFAGGLKSIDKLGKQRSIKYGFFDDWDAAPLSDKKQGSIFDLLQQRFATAANSMKQYYISTPETRPSNIENVYLKGDQRKWMLPCPRCGSYIELKWSQIKYQKDKEGMLIPESVHYECQECTGTFREKYKYEMNLLGKWIPTAKPFRPGYYSYHISALTAAPHMYNWTHYVYQWLDIYKTGNESKSKLKVFTNLVLGEPWQEKIEQVKANILSRNTRSYRVGIVPTIKSQKDGSGSIILLTCSCDLNGTPDDARLDYEVVGWSETGSCYSIDAGSIGTYGTKNDNRDVWSYKPESNNNVWTYFYDEIINKDYYTDNGESMRILRTAVDTGYLENYCFQFIDKHKEQVVGVKGTATDKYQKSGADIPLFKSARERPNLYILQVDLLKDRLSENIALRWENNHPQPAGFMNFPEPSDGKYTVRGYFAQYETEKKMLQENEDGETTGYKWVRKNSHAANHYFDCAVYNLAMKDIILFLMSKELNKKLTWIEFVDIVKELF